MSGARKIDVDYVAQLARLRLNDADKPGLQKDMDAIVGYIGELSEVDVTGVEPMAHAVETTNAVREDVSRPGYAREQMLANAPALVDGDLIKVPQVLPGEGMS